MSELTTPFLENAGKNIGCSPMSEGASQEYVMAVMLESGEHSVPMEQLRDEKIFVIEILLKRIEVHNLPIKFTPEGLIAAYAMTENNPGRAVVLLIDCLTKHEGETVNAGMLAELYPYGFYSEETMCDYIDNYLKNPEVKPKVKWAELY